MVDTVQIKTSKTSSCPKLMKSVAISDKQLDQARRRRTEFEKHIAGPYYGTNPLDIRQPLNIIYSIAASLEPTLAIRSIKSTVDTRTPANRYFADRMRMVLDYSARKMKVAAAVRDAVRNSLVSVGLVKTGTDDAGSPFCESISLDDWIIDHRARSHRPGAYAYEGHRFRIGYEEAMDGDLFDEKAKRVIETMQKDPRGENRADTISTPETMQNDEYDQQIELIELYIPRTQSVVWLPGSLTACDSPLREAEWYGSESGPYDMLGFSWVSDNMLPLPIVAVIFDLYLLENTLATQAARQAQNQKDVAVIDATSPKPGEDIRKAQDQDFVYAPGIKANVLSFGGVNEKHYAAIGYFHDFLTRISGNTELIGGAKAQSNTLGQDQILMGNATVRLEDMRGAVHDMAASIMEKLAWYVWHDDAMSLNMSQKHAGGIELPVSWAPNDRVGAFNEYDFGVSMHSRQNETPEVKYNKIKDMISAVILPLAPFAAQNGSFPNVDTLVNTAGEALDLPEIDDMWVEGAPAAVAGVSAPAPETMQPGQAMPAMRRGSAPSPIEDMAAAAVQNQGAQ